MGCKSCKKDKLGFKVKYIKNFLRFLFLNIKSGFKMVGYEDYQNRLFICHGCIFYNEGLERCTDCGCWVTNKAKYKTEDCPQGYWRKLNITPKKEI